MYFQQVNITGSWAEATQAGGYVFKSESIASETPTWLTFGKVAVKVVHGSTNTSIHYLNVYVKNLGRAGFLVGGLLGEDDHGDATTPPPACDHKLRLQKSESQLQNRGSLASALF
jgi:hypothetical protein